MLIVLRPIFTYLDRSVCIRRTLPHLNLYTIGQYLIFVTILYPPKYVIVNIFFGLYYQNFSLKLLLSE